MNQVLETYKLIKKKDCGCEEIYTIEICIDPDPQNPREDENIGKMVCFTKNHNLGDKHDISVKDVKSFSNLKEILKEKYNARYIFPLYLFDHSGLTISMDSEKFRGFDPCGWDWSQIGYIYVTFLKIHEYNLITESEKEIENILEAEVAEYDKYLKGDFYGYIFKINGEQEESCWGFDDKEEALNEAKAIIDKNGDWKLIT